MKILRGILSSLFVYSLFFSALYANEFGLPDKISGFKISYSSYNKKLPIVFLIATGGTIAEVDKNSKGAVPGLNAEELLNSVPCLKKLANIAIVNFCNIDSSHMTPQIWLKLSKLIDDIAKYPNVKGFVITHGTDTMAEGAFFTALTLKTRKPVVFTGAMMNASSISPDGPNNLNNAVVQASYDKAQGMGTTLTFNSYINSPHFVRKVQSVNVDAFNSGAKGYLGIIVDGKITKLNDIIVHSHFNKPSSLPEIPLFFTYPGDNGSYIKYAADSGVKGIVIAGVGAGNVNSDVAKAVQYAISKHILVLITTEVENGGFYPLYGDVGGGEYLLNRGVIPGGFLSPQKARLLLMLAIANNYSKKEIVALIKKEF